jgi:hypothetical protein
MEDEKTTNPHVGPQGAFQKNACHALFATVTELTWVAGQNFEVQSYSPSVYDLVYGDAGPTPHSAACVSWYHLPATNVCIFVGCMFLPLAGFGVLRISDAGFHIAILG